jgi:ribosome biogenesis GTPase
MPRKPPRAYGGRQDSHSSGRSNSDPSSSRSDDLPVPWHRPGNISEAALPGLVIRAYGKFFDVKLRDEARLLLSTIKGTLKRDRRKTDLVAVGDRVWVVDVGEDEGQIEAIEPRTRVLARPARNTEDVEQVVLANPDQVLFVFSVREPDPHRRMLDRFLILAEYAGLPARVCINKLDLDLINPGGEPLSRSIFGDYESIYPVHYVSTQSGAGTGELRNALEGTISVIAGPSGVGKSSLLNALDPDNQRAVGIVSTATGKGRHTTTATVLYHLDQNTYVADTPGIRALAMHGVPLEALDRCFPEFRPYLGSCFYADCTHLHEPGCPVRDALKAGAFSPRRYESYAALRRGDKVEE